LSEKGSLRFLNRRAVTSVLLALRH
jgi:hypothetical protein